MKQLILSLSVVSLCSLNVMAQPATVSRLTNQAMWMYYNGALNPQDSAYNTYTGDNGLDSVTKQWKYDTNTYFSNNGSGSGLQKKGKIVHGFDAQKRITDFTRSEWNGSSYINRSRTLYTYTAQEAISVLEEQDYDGANWIVNNKTTNSYDAQGKLTEYTYQNRSGTGPLANSGRTVFSYNSLGNRDTITEYDWNSSTNQWAASMHIVYYYSGTANTAIVVSAFDGTSWMEKDSTIFAYDNNGKMTENERKIYVAGSWSGHTKNVYAYDAAGNEISWTGYSYTGSGYDPAVLAITIYNSFNQPTLRVTRLWDADSNAYVLKNNARDEHFYYEQFTTGVQETAVQNGTVQVFPMPANNTLTLDLNWSETQPATVMLFDMTGKLAGQWITPTAKQHTQMLDISNIPSGTYLLKVMGTKGVLNQQVQLIK